MHKSCYVLKQVFVNKNLLRNSKPSTLIILQLNFSTLARTKNKKKVNFQILIDEVETQKIRLKSDKLFLFHMNYNDSNRCEGVKKYIAEHRKRTQKYVNSV